MIPQIGREVQKDRAVQNLQDQVATSISVISLKEIVDGNLVADVVLPAGVLTPVPHFLDRVPKGVFVASRNAASAVVEPSKVTRTDRLVFLQSASTITVDLWVF